MSTPLAASANAVAIQQQLSHNPLYFAHSHHRVLSRLGIFRRRRRRRHPGGGLPPPPPPPPPPSSFTSKQLAGLYGYPSVPAASPTNPLPAVAILELGGGYQLSDMQAFCSANSIPVPPITDISIAGATNSPTGNPQSADGEVGLDMQCVAGATLGLAPLFMIWAPNQSNSFAAAVQWVATNAAAHGIVALSISWGQFEAGWQQSDMQAMDAALQACAAAGVSVFAASGDSGSDDDGQPDDVDVDYPAASPYCFGCGGTTGRITGANVLSETAWSGSGGGYSADYAKPSWQVGNSNTARGVPDAAGVADPATGYQVWIDGQQQVIGGTSAVAPMWAGLAACLCGAKGKKTGYGLFAPLLYGMAGKATTDVMSGSNGAFQALIGYDPVTGEGTPLGKKILALLP